MESSWVGREVAGEELRANVSARPVLFDTEQSLCVFGAAHGAKSIIQDCASPSLPDPCTTLEVTFSLSFVFFLFCWDDKRRGNAVSYVLRFERLPNMMMVGSRQDDVFLQTGVMTQTSSIWS